MEIVNKWFIKQISGEYIIFQTTDNTYFISKVGENKKPVLREITEASALTRIKHHSIDRKTIEK